MAWTKVARCPIRPGATVKPWACRDARGDGGNPPLACTLVAVQEPTRTLTPYGGLAPSEGGARGYRLGARFLLDRRSSWV